MKDLDKLEAGIRTSRQYDKAGNTIGWNLHLGFYDPTKDKDLIRTMDWESIRKLCIVSAKEFLSYTDGSSEQNATIRERYPVLTAFLEGGVISIPVVTARLYRNVANRITSEGRLPKDVRVFASHDAWSNGETSLQYALDFHFTHFTNTNYELTDGSIKCIFENVTVNLKWPEIPKMKERIFSTPQRFDELSTFKDLKRLFLSLVYWPDEIALFTAVTRYFNEKPFCSTIVYHPKFHTMKDVFVRLFSHTKKGFTSSLLDICKVLDIRAKHDSNTEDAEKFTGYAKIGGLDSATVRAYLGLRAFCRVKEIAKFKEVLDKETQRAKEFYEKLISLQNECETILKLNPESDLRDLSKKLIEDLYEDVVVDPSSFAAMSVKNGAWESRDLMITQVLSNLCLTSQIEDELENNPTEKENDGTKQSTTDGNAEADSV